MDSSEAYVHGILDIAVRKCLIPREFLDKVLYKRLSTSTQDLQQICFYRAEVANSDFGYNLSSYHTMMNSVGDLMKLWIVRFMIITI